MVSTKWYKQKHITACLAEGRWSSDSSGRLSVRLKIWHPQCPLAWCTMISMMHYLKSFWPYTYIILHPSLASARSPTSRVGTSISTCWSSRLSDAGNGHGHLEIDIFSGSRSCSGGNTVPICWNSSDFCSRIKIISKPSKNEHIFSRLNWHFLES